MTEIKPADADVFPDLHTELPFGAHVVVSFEGKVIRTSEGGIVLSTDAETWVNVSWGWPGDQLDTPDPLVRVLDYGFKPGDVANRRTERMVDGALEVLQETFFATTSSTVHRDLDWLDTDGVPNDVDLSVLKLVLRDGFPVPPTDSDYED